MATERAGARRAAAKGEGHHFPTGSAANWGRVLAVCVAGVLLASCGSTGGADTASSGTSRPTTTATPRPTKVPTTAAPTTAAPTTAAPTTAAPTTAAPTTTTAPPPQAPTWDQIKGASIPAMCTHPPTTLVDGKDVTLAENQGYFELLQTLQGGTPGLVMGVPSNDAGPLTAVVVSCNAGGVGWPNSIAFFSSGGAFYAQTDLYEGIDWTAKGLNAPGRDGVVSLSLADGKLAVYTSAEAGQDASCCPSTYASVIMHAQDHRIVIDDLYEDIGD